MNHIDSRNWQIGQVIFDFARRELRVGQHCAYLEPKLFTLLALLLESPQYQVSRDQLITQVWSGRVVSESAINRVISLLRKAFSTLDPYSHYIETLPKVGYRLVVPVKLVPPDELTAINQHNEQRLAELGASKRALAASAQVEQLSEQLSGEQVSEQRSGEQLSGQPLAKEPAHQLAGNQTESATYTVAQFQGVQADFAAQVHKVISSRWFLGALLIAVLLALTWNFRGYWSSPHWLSTKGQPLYITYEAGSETSVSADSKQIFYQRAIAGTATELWLKPQNDRHAPAVRIPVKTITDAAQRQRDAVAFMAKGRLSTATLSPDGLWLLFAEYQSQHCQVYLLSTTAEQMRALFDCPADSEFQASWQADSQAFFYRQRQNKTKPYAVYRFTLATAKQQQLTAPASDELAGSLLIAAAPQGPVDAQQGNPSGAAVAMLRYLDHEHTELRLMHETTWQPEAIEIFPMNISNMQWLRPDLLLFSSGKNVYQYHLPSKRLQPLYAAREEVESFHASADRLLVAEQKRQSTIRRFSMINGDSERLVEFEGINVMPRVRSRDQQLFFLSNIFGYYQIWQQSAGNVPTMLSELPQPGFTRMALSSDQQSLVFSQLGAVYQLDIAKGSTAQLLEPEFKANVVNLDNSSNSLIFSSNRSGDWQLWRFDLAKKQLNQLTEDGGYSGIIYENDLYFSRYHQPGLWRKPLPKGEAELLIPDLDVVNWLNWHIDQQQIYFYRPNSGIWRYTIANKQQQLVMPISNTFVHQFNVSGQYIYVVERNPSEGNIAQLMLTTEP